MSEATVLGGQEVVGVGRIEGPILIVEGATNVSYDEVVEIRDPRGQLRRGRVLEVGEGHGGYPGICRFDRLIRGWNPHPFSGRIRCTCRLPRKCSGASSMVWATRLMAVRSR